MSSFLGTLHYPSITFLDKILCLDSNDCYVVTTNSYGFPELFNTVYMTSNQGRTWSLKFDDVISEDSWWAFNIRDFDVVDSNHIYIAMSESSVIKYTEDGGKTIKNLQFPDNRGHSVLNIIMMDTLKGLAIKTSDIFRTFDGWKTYDSVAKGVEFYRAPQKKNDSIIWFTYFTINEDIASKHMEHLIEYNINTDEEKIIYAFKDEYLENSENLELKDLYFINDTLGFVCGERDIGEPNDRNWDLIYKTTDGGKSWKNVLKDINGRPFGLDEISFADENLGVSVGSNGKLYETTDGGETWLFKETPEEFDDPTTRVEFAGQIAIVGEMNGNVWTWQYPDDTTGVSVEDLIRSSKLHVIKRQEELRIAIADPQYRSYRLEIVDIMGRKVINKSINSNAAGNVYHTINIKNLNNNSPYFIAISHNGAIIHTQKFIK